MADRSVVWWLLMAISASLVCLAKPSGPKDYCKEDSNGSWVDLNIKIPEEKAPDNILHVKARCKRDIEGTFFDRSGAPDTDINAGKPFLPAARRSHSFVGKSGKRHALLSPRDSEPAIVPPFATEFCKLSKATADVEANDKPTEKVTVVLECNAGKNEIVRCKADGQSDWIKPDGSVVYFGGKGKLNSIQCAQYDPPDISVSYARDVCNADQKDKIDVKDGSKPITVFFDCNKENDAIVACFPNKKTAENAIQLGTWGGGDTFGYKKFWGTGSFKRITCGVDSKPVIGKFTFDVDTKPTYLFAPSTNHQSDF